MTETAFVGATLIDGTGAPPLAGSAVVVAKGRIRWVGAASRLDLSPDIRVVDLAGKYVTPGLLDANTHLLGQFEPDVLLRYEAGCYDELVIEAAQVALRAGITTVFDTWGPLEALRRTRDRINAGEVTGSRILFAGNIIGLDGPWSEDCWARYGQALNPAVVESVNRQWSQGVGAELTWMSADDVRESVREYIATSGIDFVKYSSSSHGTVRFIAFSPDAQRAIVEEAHAAGMTAQACTMAPEALKLAIEAGVDLLQHGDVTGPHPMPAPTLELIAERQLPCVAFLYTERYMASINERGIVESKASGHEVDWTEPLRVKDENGRRLIAAGAKLLMANDATVLGPTAETSPYLGVWFGSRPDVPIHLGTHHILWIRAAIERGMAPMDALLCATRNIAEGYGKLGELGTVEVGKRADLLVLDADPLADPEHYGRVAYVVKDGEIVEREKLPEQPVLTRAA